MKFDVGPYLFNKLLSCFIKSLLSFSKQACFEPIVCRLSTLQGLLGLHFFLVPFSYSVLYLLNLLLAVFFAVNFHGFSFLFFFCSSPDFDVIHFFLFAYLEVFSFTTLQALELRQNALVVKLLSLSFDVCNFFTSNFSDTFLFQFL